MLAFLSISVVALIVVLALTPWVRRIAIRHDIGDYPSVRKIHKTFIPRMGGIGIIAGFAAGIAVLLVTASDLLVVSDVNLAGVGAAILLIVGLGVYDDIRGVGSVGKLIVQCLASILVIASGLNIDSLALPFLDPIDVGLAGIPLTFLWLVGLTNAVNLLDGLDGLAAGVAAIVATSFLLIGLYTHDMLIVYSTTALLFACLGFLRYNFHPASIFMGDTGSLFLGFVLGCISLLVMRHSSAEVMPLSLLVPVAALAVPIVDTSVAFFRRLKKGMHPLKPDKEHIHHRLMDLGLTHRQTVVTIYAISLFNGVIAYLLAVLDDLYSLVLLIIVFVAMFVSIRRLGYVEEMRARRQDSVPPIKPLSVAQIIDRAVLVCGDLAALFLAFVFTHWFRFESGFHPAGGSVPFETYITSPAALILVVYWLLLFYLAGLYEISWDVSRVDYIFSIVKAGLFGTLLLFLITLDFTAVTLAGRLASAVYGASVIMSVTVVRMLIVGFERRHEILGFRRRNTLLVGASPIAEVLLNEISARRGLKYNVVGFIDPQPEMREFRGYPVFGNYSRIPELVKERSIEEILITTKYDSREEILDVVARCNGLVPSVKVVPESIDALSGFKIEQIVGHPLVRIYPTNLRTWQRFVKRLIDIVVSLAVLIPFLPVWILVALLIKLDSPGPVFFVQDRVGKKGKIFRLYKFRSMIHEAERETGPVWAKPGDERVTRVGRFMRKLRIDEVPQFLNVLKGEMSLVGPRPERLFFVEQLQKEINFYTRRLLVRPGITGWSQITLHYDRSLDDVKKKIKYDLYYLENMSLTLDLKIILRTILVALSGKGTH